MGNLDDIDIYTRVMGKIFIKIYLFTTQFMKNLLSKNGFYEK